jgi:hypothetical protein
VPGGIRSVLLKSSALVLPPATESTFHIAESSSIFRRIIFPPLESRFCIAKRAAYLIEKQE